MTFDEIRDLVDNTINENGARSITGKALNRALNELVSAVETNVEEALDNAGSGTERIYANMAPSSGEITVTEEQKALNAALYEKLKTAFETDKLIPNVGFQLYAEVEGTAQGMAVPTFLIVKYQPSQNMIVFLSDMQLVLSSDGTVTMGG